MRLKALLLIAGPVVASLAACDKPFEDTDTPPMFGGSAGGTVSPPPPVSEPPKARPTSGCPPEEPEAYSKCENGASCIYGNDVENMCNNVLVCSGGQYQFMSGTSDCVGRCPTDFAQITVGGACSDTTMACSYRGGTCACIDDGAEAGEDAGSEDADAGAPRPGHWKCVPPPESPACPLARPPDESECVKPMTCDYGSCELSRPLTVRCTGVMWMKTTAVDCR